MDQALILKESNPMSDTAMTSKPNVLIVDDNENNTFLMESILFRTDVNIIVANSAKVALEKIKDTDIALALLDIVMPVMDGIELAMKIQLDKSRELFPIIFITAIEKVGDDLQECYDAGGVDFILKPFKKNILLSKVNVFLELYRQKQQIILQKAEIERKAIELETTNATLETRLAYENMLSKISGMAVQVEDIENFLEESVTLMGETTNVSRTYIFKYIPEKNMFDNTQEWCNKDVNPEKDNLQGLSENQISYWTETLKTGEIINFQDTEDIPDEEIKLILRDQNTLSALAVPIFVESRFYGFIGFDHCLYHKEWASEDIAFLQAITRILASAIERKQSENALRESEAKFKYIFDSANVGKSITYPTGGLIVNKAFGNIVGYSVEELLHKAWQEITATEEIQYIQEKLSSMLKGEKDSDRFEKKYIHKNGSVVWTDLSVVLQRDANGNPLHFITTIVDITERKRAEALIDEARKTIEWEKNLLQTVMDGAKNAHLVYLDRDFNYVRVNKTYAQSCLQTPEEMIGQNHFAWQYPNSKNEAVFTQVRDSGQYYETQDSPFLFPNQPERGTTYWDWSLNPIKDDSDFITGMVLSLFETTERKQAEEKIRKLSQAVEQSPASVVITNLNGDIEYVNSKFVEVTGFSFEEVYGENPRILKSGKQSPATYKELWNTISAGREWQGEFENRKKNGELFWESVSISPIRNKDGKITHFLAVKEDVTKRKNAEKAFYQSEAKLRRITDNISDVVFTTDLNFKLTYITPSIEKLTGHKLDIYIDSAVEDRIPPNALLILQLRLIEELEKEGIPTVDKNRTIMIDTQLYRADYSILDISMHNSIIRDEHGTPVGIQGIMRDITQLKQAESTLRMSEQKYRTMINSSPDGIFLISLKGIITEVSEIGLELLETNDRSELVGKHFHRLIPPDEKETVKDMIYRTLEEGLVQNVEIRILNINQKPFLSETSLSLIQSPDGEPVSFLVTIRDISQRKKLEQKQIHASRMASLGEMATGIAHEINQPLNIISLALDNLVLEADISDSVNKQYLLKKTGRIFENIDRMKNIIDHVRSFSRNQDDYILTGFNVNDSIRNALSMISEQLKHSGISLYLNLQDGLPQITGNTFKLEQVILNLISNAKDTILEKNNRVQSDFEMSIKIRSYRRNGNLVIEVTDNGMGISNKEVDMVMMPFYSTKDEGKGTGLGLSISYQLVKEMNGIIEIESKIKEGTTFRIVLNLIRKKTG